MPLVLKRIVAAVVVAAAGVIAVADATVHRISHGEMSGPVLVGEAKNSVRFEWCWIVVRSTSCFQLKVAAGLLKLIPVAIAALEWVRFSSLGEQLLHAVCEDVTIASASTSRAAAFPAAFFCLRTPSPLGAIGRLAEELNQTTALTLPSVRCTGASAVHPTGAACEKRHYVPWKRDRTPRRLPREQVAAGPLFALPARIVDDRRPAAALQVKAIDHSRYGVAA